MTSGPASLRWRVVALVGLRAAGKTTIGRALAAELRWPFADGDEVLAAATGRPAGEWLAAVGEVAFRQREADVLLPLLRATGPLVLATGGGAVTIPAVRDALRAEGVFAVWLDAPSAVLLARQLAAPGGRPALTGLPLAAEIEALAAARAGLYGMVARARVDTGGGSAAQLARDLAVRLAASGPYDAHS